MKKAVFMDKDGTLIVDVPYNVNPDRIQLHNGAAEALCVFRRMGYMVIIISNQSGIARGFFEERDLSGVVERIRKLLQKHGTDIDAFYFCPHHPEGVVPRYAQHCSCRKPEPGMIMKAARDFDVDLTSSWMVGDILHDVEAGNRAGCKTILLDTGNETEWDVNEIRTPDIVVKNFHELTTAILQKQFHHDVR